MQSSNPAFRNIGRNSRAQGQPVPSADYIQTMFNQPSLGAPARERFLTLDDVVAKTATVLSVGILSAVLAIWLHLTWALALPALLIGFGISMFVIFKRSTNPGLILAYSVAEGLALGAVTGVFQSIPKYQGIGLQALVGTFGVFAGMLLVYKTGAIRVTPKFTRFVVGALVGAMVLVLFDVIMAAVGVNTYLNNGGGFSIVLTVVFIVIAALSFLLDFDQIDRAIKAGAPASAAWYFAFSLMVTMVWLYIEILRLLGSMRR